MVCSSMKSNEEECHSRKNSKGRLVTEKDLGELLVGDMSLPFDTEVQAHEFRIEVERKFFELFRRWYYILKIIEGNKALPVPIEELKS